MIAGVFVVARKIREIGGSLESLPDWVASRQYRHCAIMVEACLAVGIQFTVRAGPDEICFDVQAGDVAAFDRLVETTSEMFRTLDAVGAGARR